MDTWLSIATYAKLIGVTAQAARKRCRQRSSDRRGSGHGFTARSVSSGRGGRSGTRYEILLESLPPDLQARYRERLGGDEAAPTAPVGGAAALPTHVPPQAIHWEEGVHDARLASFQKVERKTLERTPERAQLIKAEAATLGLSESGYRQAFKRYQEEGVAHSG